MNNYKHILVVAISLLLSYSLFAQDLVILHTNDSHSQIEPIRTGQGAGKGGVHRRAEYYKQVKKEHKNVLILDAGDYNQGTPYFNLFKGDLEIELMNAMGVEVACLGNHEFDNGIEELTRRLKKAKFKTVCANYDFSGTPIKNEVEPYVIVNKAGKKIGIVGLLVNLRSLTMAETYNRIKFLDPIEIANKYAKFLKEEKGCDMVIALTHLGYSSRYKNAASDITLAKESENIDIIVGGHSHTYLKSEKTYKNKKGENVIVLQAGAKGEYVGRLDISF